MSVNKEVRSGLNCILRYVIIISAGKAGGGKKVVVVATRAQVDTVDNYR